MIIDFHTHVFPDKLAAKTIPMLAQRSHTAPNTDGTAAGLLKHMEESGVDVSVVLPVVTAPRQFDSINRFAAQLNEQESKKAAGPRLLSFGGIHPDNENPAKLLRQLKERGFQGIKLHPDYQGVFINDIRNLRILEAAAELDLIVTIHAGTDIGLPEPVHCPPDKMAAVFKQIPYSKIVLAHTGGWQQWDMVEEYLVDLPLYFDLSFSLPFISNQQLMRILTAHTPQRCLFATDSPWGNQKDTLQMLKQLPLPEGWLDQLCSGTAKKLLGWD